MSLFWKDKINVKVLQLGKGVILSFSLVISIFLSITSFLSTAYFEMDYLETTYYKRDSLFLHLLVTCIFLILLYWLAKKKILERISSKKLCVILLFYVAIFAGVWSVVSHAIPTADQAKLIECAEAFIVGDFRNLGPGKYLQICPQQLGYVAYLEVLFRVLGTKSYAVAESINVCFICLEFYMIYKITELVFENKKITNLVLILLFGFMPYLFFSTFIYGEMLASPLALIAVYGFIRFMRENKISYSILAILSLGLSVLLKENNLIVVIAIILYLMMKGLEQKKLFVY